MCFPTEFQMIDFVQRRNKTNLNNNISEKHGWNGSLFIQYSEKYTHKEYQRFDC